MEIKPSAFSHSWYPGSAGECQKAIEGFIRENRDKKPVPPPRCAGGIVPHAGWFFSGRIACRVIAALAGDDQAPDTIVLFGAHMRRTDPSFILASGGVDTPLGPIEADPELAGAVAGATGAALLSPANFPDENTLELQYPFIKHFFPKARLVAIGTAPSDQALALGLAAVAEAEKLGRQVKIIGSTDMTHYGPNFGFTPQGTGTRAVDWVTENNDAAAVRALENLDVPEILSQGLTRQNMCCCGAAAAAATACKKRGAAKGLCLDYATSFEKSRSDSFVGYCGMVYPLN